MNNLFWKIVIPLLGGIGATASAVSVFKFSEISNIPLLILLATIAGGLGNQVFTLLGKQLMRFDLWIRRSHEGEVVFSFLRLPEEEAFSSKAGGKGKSLARLFKEGYPVPDGCVLLSSAFDDKGILPEAWQQVEAELFRLRKKGATSFAVRSSALQEDSARASFAGEFESVLNVRTDEEIRLAIQRVLESRQSTRVSSYIQAQGLEGGLHPVAVVIQKMVEPDHGGVLFTVDPLNGDFSHMTGNFVEGIGEKLVSGQVIAQEFSISRPAGKYCGPELMKKPAVGLYQMARNIETLMGSPQDIEWAVSGGKVYILQARPITTLNGFDPVKAVWNDSMKGNFLWSATNLMEASPNVLTPFTASLLPYLTNRGGPSLTVKNYPINGIIGGRFYVNISVQVSAFVRLFGGNVQRTYQELAGWWGEIPDGMSIPLIPLTGEEWFRTVFPQMNKSISLFGKYRKLAPQFLAENRQVCVDLREKVAQTSDKKDLLTLWEKDIFPRYRDSFLYIVANSLDVQIKVERELKKLVGAEEANALMSNLSGSSSMLESMGPMAGLAQVTKGQMSREEYIERYGHRGVNEGEVAWPRPYEDPNWLDGHLKEWEKSPVDIDALVSRQRMAFAEAWGRFCVKHPGKTKSMKARLAQAASAAQMRERVRSEATRGMTVLRAFTLKAGDLLGVGNAVFYLTIDEILQGLTGEVAIPVELIPQRKETYERYSSLPPYPALICGRFDPFAWAADPNRRTDIFDASMQSLKREVQDDKTIHGFAGALGVVDGIVRKLESMEDSDKFKAGEILVTTMTNIGWTPLFPRAAAIVTDLGAPLSHAAIVARELGIPAVVGCGNASARLKTGDRVRVNGGQGLVEIL